MCSRVRRTQVQLGSFGFNASFESGICLSVVDMKFISQLYSPQGVLKNVSARRCSISFLFRFTNGCRRTICLPVTKIKTSSPSKHFIILVHPCLVFQWKLFALGEIIHFFHILNSYQVGVTNKVDPIEIICFSFLPVGGRINIYSTEYIRLIDICKYLKANAAIVNQVMQVIHYCQFSSLIGRIMNSSKVSEKTEF